MRHAAVSSAVVFAPSLIAERGGPNPPNAEGRSPTRPCHRAIAGSRVPRQNISAAGQRGDGNHLYACDQDPDGAASTGPATPPGVAAACTEEDSLTGNRPKVGWRR